MKIGHQFRPVDVSLPCEIGATKLTFSSHDFYHKSTGMLAHHTSKITKNTKPRFQSNFAVFQKVRF
jgi:hypothetical protein